MNLLGHLIGTFLMFLGFFGVLFGILLLRLKQEDLGRMYLATTMMGGGEMSEGLLNRLLLGCRANDRTRRRWAILILTAGGLLSLAGAALT